MSKKNILFGVIVGLFSVIFFAAANIEFYYLICDLFKKAPNSINLNRFYSTKIICTVILIIISFGFFVKNSLGHRFTISIFVLFCLSLYILPAFEFDKSMGFFGSLIERYKDPNFLKNDWWLNVSEDVNAYYFYTKFLSIFSSNYLPQILFLLWCFVIISYGFIVMYISKLLIESDQYIFVGTVSFIFGISTIIAPNGDYGMFALGDNDFLYYWLTPQSLSLCFAFFSLFMYWKNYWIYSSILMGFSLLFHINTGQHFIFIIFVCFLVDIRNNLSRDSVLKFVAWGILSILISLPNLLPVLDDFIGKAASNYEPTYSLIMVMGGFRQPHHLVPSTWSQSIYLYFFLLFWIAICGFYMKTDKNIVDKYLLNIVIAIFILCFMGYFFVEIFPIDLFALLQVFRLTLVAKIIFIQYFSITFITILFKIFKLTNNKIKNFVSVYSLSIILIISLCLLIQGSYKQINIIPTEPLPVEKWIRENTAWDSIFVMLPDNNLREFPVKAKRALFADHNRVPYQGYRYEEWFIRMCDAFNLTYKPDLQEILRNRWKTWTWNFQNKGFNSFKLLSKKYGVTHVLTWNYHYISGADLIYTDDHYNVYQL